ncbi:TPA: acyltransferase family protein [Kluyvera georgiana]
MQKLFGTRIYTLDILRGIAALSVVLWHWQHFFMNDKNVFVTTSQPFYKYLSIFYTHGLYAVELFFVISGFIFFYLYSDGIYLKKVSFKSFFVKRLSRLYPLYIISFVFVALLQILYFHSHNTFFVYPMNDIYHAILNIFMVQSWGFEKGWSYNAPTWSVSIEMLMYLFFFMLCALVQKRITSSILIVLIAFMLYNVNNAIMIGAFCFFLGGICFKITEQSIYKFGAQKSLLIASLAFIIAWFFILKLKIDNVFLIVIFGFTSLTCVLAMLNAVNKNLGKKIEWIGDISYSSYLLHFPLQIIFVLYYDFSGYGRNVFYKPYVMIIFMVTLVIISYTSFKLIESPLQRKLRTLLSR